MLSRRGLRNVIRVVILSLTIHFFVVSLRILIQKYHHPSKPSQNMTLSYNRKEIKLSKSRTDIVLPKVRRKPQEKVTNVTQKKVMKIMDFNPRANCTQNLHFRKCEYDACAMTSQPEEADVLMFNAMIMKNIILPKRPLGQIWLAYTREPMTDSRIVYLNQPSLIGQFNWTRTYFSDSTFLNVYGTLFPRERPLKNYEKIYGLKKYDVAWFVSKCKTRSKRESYVRRMSAEVQVHIYGRCGNNSCGSTGFDMGGKRMECLRMLSRDYKFYLSFENSFCRDYVSEKFFNVFPDIDVIPVVRGGGNYPKIAPAGVYIDSRDFESPEQLGKYLRDMSRDKGKYLNMLMTKDGYTKYFPDHEASCELCKAAHTRSPTNVYNNIYDWLVRPGNCWLPTDL